MSGRMSLAGLVATTAAVFLFVGCSSRRESRPDAPPLSEEAAPADIRPADAVQAILEAFDRCPIVALGESHGLEDEREFINRLVGDPRFAAKVQDIVVEFGNAKYQSVINRYLAGTEVSPAELQRVWRDHTCPGPWTSSAVLKYFAAFRAVNRALPPGQRFRVLLGDPPIDWEAVRSSQDFGRFLEQRDTHFARVVEEEVLAHGRRALLIIGGLHLLRKDIYARERASVLPPPGRGNGFGQLPGRDPSNVVRLLERRHPGKVFVVLPHDGLGEGSAELEKRFRSWPTPSLALLKGTWLGAVAANQVLPGSKDVKLIVNGKAVEMPKPDPAFGPRLEEVADALLYLGPGKSLTWAPEVDLAGDQAFQEELRRRSKVTLPSLP